MQLQRNDTEVVDTVLASPYVDINTWNIHSEFYYLMPLASGTHNFDVDFSTSNASSTAYMRHLRMEFWRVL